MRKRPLAFTTMVMIVSFASLLARSAQAGHVEFDQNRLVVDGQPQSQLWGAEIQYFRLRGGEGRNVPRATVLEIWNRALDRARDAKMNTVEFYIPWDFHEYAEGKFDFDGSVDEDGDGNPDFPSRDVRTWLRMVEDHGFKNIHVRPGPFINAEWGFLGFGAIPFWFHQKHPESHTVNPRGQKTTLYSYSDPNYRAYAKRWLETVYREVIKPYIGPGRPISFLQVDNETNLMWQSMFNHDYGPRSLGMYRKFLKAEYGNSLERLNSAHARQWADWNAIEAPTVPFRNLAEDQDWYRYQDDAMNEYLRWVRKVWEDVGVHEPDVRFTLAESYNAPIDGILPNYKLRNDPLTGMMTVNLYPKVYETPDRALMNTPFKADHDVKVASVANTFYGGKFQDWVMGPEIQAGWWRGVQVSADSRKQTYLTTLGHGMKALYLYYFNEGQNWETRWAYAEVLSRFDRLKNDPRYRDIAKVDLPENFWRELDTIVANELFVGWSSRFILNQGGSQTQDLYFDAPLDGQGLPRPPYEAVREFGEKVIAPYGEFLSKAVEVNDRACLLKDVGQHVPSGVPHVNSLVMNSDWAGGLVALFLHAGVNPRIVIWNGPTTSFAGCDLVAYQDNGVIAPGVADALRKVIDAGGGVVSFLDAGLFNQLKTGGVCAPLVSGAIEANAVRCEIGAGRLYNARTPIYDVFNTDFYSVVNDVPKRREWLENVLADTKVSGTVKIKGGGDRVVAFGRKLPDAPVYWITVKSGRLDTFSGAIQILQSLDINKTYLVRDVFSGNNEKYTGQALKDDGLRLELPPNGSTAFYIEETAP